MEFNPKVTTIPAFKSSPAVKRVGIYARVSTARTEQLHSLAVQVSGLADHVYKRNDMIIRDIYIDVGSAKTGSSRREFSRLLQDCEKTDIQKPLLFYAVAVKSKSLASRRASGLVQ